MYICNMYMYVCTFVVIFLQVKVVNIQVLDLQLKQTTTINLHVSLQSVCDFKFHISFIQLISLMILGLLYLM